MEYSDNTTSLFHCVYFVNIIINHIPFMNSIVNDNTGHEGRGFSFLFLLLLVVIVIIHFSDHPNRRRKGRLYVRPSLEAYPLTGLSSLLWELPQPVTYPYRSVMSGPPTQKPQLPVSRTSRLLHATWEVVPEPTLVLTKDTDPWDSGLSSL